VCWGLRLLGGKVGFQSLPAWFVLFPVAKALIGLCRLCTIGESASTPSPHNNPSVLVSLELHRRLYSVFCTGFAGSCAGFAGSCAGFAGSCNLQSARRVSHHFVLFLSFCRNPAVNILLLRFESGVIWPSPSRKHSSARASASTNQASASANQFIAEKPTLIFNIRHPRYVSHSFLVSTDTEPCKARDFNAFGVFQQVRDLSCGRTSTVRPEVDF
jgi:hypothetical protein